MSTVSAILTGVAIAWLPGQCLGWMITRSKDDPWNWRILLGPWAYFGWLDGREWR